MIKIIWGFSNLVSLFFTLVFFTRLHSQNLVLNPGFEDFECKRWYNSSIELCNDWSSPNLNSPDYFTNSCPGYIVASVFPNKWWGYQLPASGNAFAGFIAYRPEEDSEYSSSSVEYLQGTLAENLTAGINYTFQFDISLAECSVLSLKTLGVFFSDKKTDTRKLNMLTLEPYFLLQVTNDTSKWITLSHKFTARGNEKYFIVGCFKNEAKIKINKASPSKEITMPRKDAYYYVDDFELFSEQMQSVSIKNEDPEESLANDKNEQEHFLVELKPTIGEKIILKNVFFENGRSELLNSSFKELDQLADLLKNNSNLKIQITGHTDSKGNPEENLSLSKNRAFAVYTYFLQKEINPSRMSYSSLGDKDPVSDNTTEIGRSLNRRVEFKLIEN